jgi:hypothetical protein
VSLVARHLEANGISSVVMGCARDIVEYVGVPRFLFSDFPLGNSAGKPFDEDSQHDTLAQALALFDSATEPRMTVQSSKQWSNDPSWKDDYLNVDAMPPDEIARRRTEFAQQKAVAQRIKDIVR